MKINSEFQQSKRATIDQATKTTYFTHHELPRPLPKCTKPSNKTTPFCTFSARVVACCSQTSKTVFRYYFTTNRALSLKRIQAHYTRLYTNMLIWFCPWPKFEAHILPRHASATKLLDFTLKNTPNTVVGIYKIHFSSNAIPSTKVMLVVYFPCRWTVKRTEHIYTQTYRHDTTLKVYARIVREHHREGYKGQTIICSTVLRCVEL